MSAASCQTGIEFEEENSPQDRGIDYGKFTPSVWLYPDLHHILFLSPPTLCALISQNGGTEERLQLPVGGATGLGRTHC